MWRTRKNESVAIITSGNWEYEIGVLNIIWAFESYLELLYKFYLINISSRSFAGSSRSKMVYARRVLREHGAGDTEPQQKTTDEKGSYTGSSWYKTLSSHREKIQLCFQKGKCSWIWHNRSAVFAKPCTCASPLTAGPGRSTRNWSQWEGYKLENDSLDL